MPLSSFLIKIFISNCGSGSGSMKGSKQNIFLEYLDVIVVLKVVVKVRCSDL